MLSDVVPKVRTRFFSDGGVIFGSPYDADRVGGEGSAMLSPIGRSRSRSVRRT